MAIKKKQSIFSKIKPNSLKTRIILTVALFALVGGGVMVYKSFAAVYVWAKPIQQVRYTQGGSGGCNISNTTDAAKNALPILQMSCTGTGGDLSINTGEFSSTTDVNITANVYRACASVKGSGNISVWVNASPNQSDSGRISVNSPDAYKQICSSYAQAIGSPIKISGFMNLKQGNLKVQSLSIEKEINTAGPAPAPAK